MTGEKLAASDRDKEGNLVGDNFKIACTLLKRNATEHSKDQNEKEEHYLHSQNRNRHFQREAVSPGKLCSAVSYAS